MRVSGAAEIVIFAVCFIIAALALVAIALAQWVRGNITIQPYSPSVQVHVPPPPAPHVVVEMLPVLSQDGGHASLRQAHEPVQILKVTPDGYSHVGYRAPDHPDVALALNNTALAVRWPDGKVEQQSPGATGE